MNYMTLLTHEAQGVFTITLHRPERRNALTPAMRAELIDAFELAKKRAAILILTGAGAALCAGLDLTALEALGDASPEEQTEDAEQIAELLRSLYTIPIPTIAAVNGAAVAGGNPV